MSFFGEFKTFAMRGNMVDLAVGVIIGAAFGAVVTSLVNDIIMPPIGLITGGLDFKDHFLALNGQHYASIADAKKATAVITYGNFINVVITFLIISFCVFLLVKGMNRLMPPPKPAPVGPTPEQTLLTEIRDLLARERA